MIDVVAWAVAAALALVVTAFCVYEIRWKTRRLRADLLELEDVVGRLRSTQSDLMQAARQLSERARPQRLAERG